MSTGILYPNLKYKKGRIDRKATMTHEIEECWNGEHGYKVIKAVMVGSVYYGAIQAKGDTKIFGIACKTWTQNNNQLIYKEWSEYSGPGWCDCPMSVLNILSPTNDEWALEWRNKCIKNANNSLRKATKIQFIAPYDATWSDGTTVLKGDEVVAEKCSWGRIRREWYLDNTNCVISKSFIPNDYKVIA